jgi:undecaprenyl-diphosphatase
VGEHLTVLEAILLGVVQGLTEWLPVSSSGHLVLVQEYLGLEVTLFYDVLLHVATLGVILFFYRDTVLDVLGALARAPREHLEGATWREVWWETPPRRLAVLVVVGSVPTAAIALTAEPLLRGFFESTLVVGIALLVTGTWLFVARFAPAVDPDRPRFWDAVLVGAAQGTAFVPGISRSGATIGAALLRGVEREHAVRFSFLLSVPAIVGATVYEGSTAGLGTAANWPAYLTGMVVAALVGYAALWLLVRIVERRGFTHFCWYCWALGAAVLALAYT